MTDRQIYERAQAELQRCEQRIGELRAFLRIYEELTGLSAQVQTQERAPHQTSDKARGRSDEPMQDWEQMADAAIRREGHPLRVREIYEAIVPMGFHIDSKDPVNALTTKLSRSSHFSKAGRGLFTVTEGAAEAVRGAASDDAEDEDASERNERALAIEPPSDLWAGADGPSRRW